MTAEDRPRTRHRADVAVVGEALVQLSPPAGVTLADTSTVGLHLAGAEVNVGVALARLGRSVEAITRVGADALGDWLRRELAACGLDVSGVTTDPDAPTGLYFKDHRDGVSRPWYYRTGSAGSRLAPDAVAGLGQDRAYVHVTGVTAALGDTAAAVVERLLDHERPGGARVSFDVNHRPALWTDGAAETLLAAARRADVTFVGRDEAERLWGMASAPEIRAALSDVPVLVVKDADQEATCFRGSAQVRVPALPVEVVEPVGAGDAFAAGCLAAWLDGHDDGVALRWGHILASRVLRTTADQVDAPPPGLLAAASSASEADWADGALAKHPYLAEA